LRLCRTDLSSVNAAGYDGLSDNVFVCHRRGPLKY
jgi:hypothetical protein